MKVQLLALLTALLAVAFAASTDKTVIVSYPEDTPDSVLAEAKKAVTDAGGIITHEYNLIKAFAAKGSEKAFARVSALSEEHHGVIEEDQQVHAVGGRF